MHLSFYVGQNNSRHFNSHLPKVLLSWRVHITSTHRSNVNSNVSKVIRLSDTTEIEIKSQVLPTELAIVSKFLFKHTSSRCIVASLLVSRKHTMSKCCYLQDSNFLTLLLLKFFRNLFVKSFPKPF